MDPIDCEDQFDPQALQWNGTGTSAWPSRTARREQQFMPALPEQIFREVAALPGKALAVYLVILLRSRYDRSRTVTLTSSFLARFGLNRKEKAGALRQLEGAGFLTVERRPRRNPVITLQEKNATGGCRRGG